jgi:hypothetical protein
LPIVEKQERRLGVSHVAANVANRLVDVAVRYGKIEPAIEIGIEKNTSKAQTILGSHAHAGLRRDVFVGFPAELVEAGHLVVEVCNGHARSAGVHEIGNIHAHAGAGFALGAKSQSNLDGCIFERSVVLVAIQLVGLSVVRDQQIGPAILLVIEAWRRQAILNCCRKCRWRR